MTNQSARDTCQHEYRFAVCRRCRHVEGFAPEFVAAPRRRRLMASGEDVMLSVAIAGFLSLLVLTLAPSPLKALAFGQPSPSWAPGMTANWFRLALIAPCATLATYALPVIVYRAGSVGKQSRALVVMRVDGHRPSLRRMLLREWLYKGLGTGSGVIFGLAALTGTWSVAPLAALAFMDACLILFSLDGRTLGDRIFGTRVLLKTDAVAPSAWEKLRASAQNLRRSYNVNSNRDR